MSVRKKPEKAVSVIRDRLSKAKGNAMQVLKVEVVPDQNNNIIHESTFDDIESKLKRMADSLSKTRNWEKRVADQLCALEQVLDHEIFTFDDPEMESPVHDEITLIEDAVDELKLILISMMEDYPDPDTDTDPNANDELSSQFEGIESKLRQMTDSLSKIKNSEKKVADQFRVLEQDLLDDDVFTFKDPNPENELSRDLNSKFDSIESKLKQITDSLSKIRNWERKVVDQFCALEKALDDEIFPLIKEAPEMKSQVQDKLTLMKGDVAELKKFVPLSTVDQNPNPNPNLELISKFHGIESELKVMTDSLSNVKNWEKKVVDQLCALEQVLDHEIFTFKDPEMTPQVDDRLTLIEENVVKLKSLFSTVDHNPNHEPSSKIDGTESELKQMADSQKWAQLVVEDKMERDDDLVSALHSTFNCLDDNSHLKICLLSLSVFPENTHIKKRPLIYWWIGEGFVAKTENSTADAAGEQVLQELLNEGFIKPTSTTTNNTNSFRVYPWIHRMLIQLAQKNNIMKFNPNGSTPCNGSRRAFLRRGGEGDAMNDDERVEDLLTVFNVDEQYLGSRSEWLSRLHRVEVLQMGRWQDSVTHHIELEDYRELLKGLGSQKHLKYLSLRGISRIETLPRSIKNLVSLQILDLKACHNLEELPPTLSELRNLTHLDVSECYLLESMPKGLERLSKLQVLKGFVAGSRAKNSCKISDLARGLQALRKLSVRVRDLGNEQLGSLFNFSEALCILTISWGVVKVSNSPMSEMLEALPTALTKLDLRSVPFQAVPGWLRPEKLPGKLEKLYVKGGKLKLDNINRLDYSNVKIFRLKCLI